MTTPNTITSEIQKLEPSAIIELFELDLTTLGGDIYYFHAGTNALSADIIWQGQTYTRYPIELSGFEYSGNGQLPRPKAVVSNLLGSITSLLLVYNDLLGAKLTRKRTLKKYLDWENFDALYTYNFDSDLEGWTDAATSTLTHSGADSFLWETTGVDPYFDITLDPADYYDGVDAFIIQARVRRVSGAEPWEGTCFYTTGGHGYNSSYRKTVDAPSSPEDWNIIEWDMRDLTAGGTDYIDEEIRGIRIDLVSTAGDVWEVDWIKINGTNYEDFTAEFNDDIYYVDRKSAENKSVVEFELAASMDVAGVMLPRRQIIQNVCIWGYRSGECGYTGTDYFNIHDNPVSEASLDKCGKKLSSCRARFGQYEEIPFGSFPSAGLIR